MFWKPGTSQVEKVNLPKAEISSQINNKFFYLLETFPVVVINGKVGNLTQQLKDSGYCDLNYKIASTCSTPSECVQMAQKYSSSFAVPFESQQGSVIYTTDCCLFQELFYDPLLSGYSVIIVNNCGARSFNTDFLLAILKKYF
jgi:hypothetical protein